MSELKKCPFCGEMINAAATQCRYCREMLDDKIPASAQAGSPASAAMSRTSEPPAETPQAPAPGAEAKSSSASDSIPVPAAAESVSAGPAGQQASAENKICPFCGETIKATATQCRYCCETLIHDAGTISENGAAANRTSAQPQGFTFTKGIVAWGVSAVCMWWAFSSFHRFMSFYPSQTYFDRRIEDFVEILCRPELKESFFSKLSGASSVPSPRLTTAALIICIVAFFLAWVWRWKENYQHVHIETNCWLVFQMLLSLLYPWAGFSWGLFLFFMFWPIIIFLIVAYFRKVKVLWTIIMLVLEVPIGFLLAWILKQI